MPTDMVSKHSEAVEVDHYKTLGLVRPVTDDQVKRAHRERVKQCHPDRGGDAAEFDAVTLAYKALCDQESRQRYEVSLENSARWNAVPVVVPDVVGKSPVDAALALEGLDVTPRVLIVPVGGRDPRARMVVGQVPVPGSRLDAGSAIGIVIAVPQSSTLWFQVKEYAAEIAGSFVDGFLRGGGATNVRRELPPSSRAVGTQAAATVGEIAGATAKVGIGIASCLLRLWAFSIGLLVVAIMIYASPTLGVVALVVLVGMTIRSFVSRSRRKSRGIWY